MAPSAGRDYPGSYAALRAWFDEDWKCLDYLDWLRWPDGFGCPHCDSDGGWRAPDRRWRCADCDRRVSATASTIFHATRTPLTVWFAAGWQLIARQGRHLRDPAASGAAAGLLPDCLGDVAPHRSVIVLPRRERLTGEVEVDESYLGGPEPGIAGRGALGKVLFAAAVEREGPKGFGRVRLSVIEDASAASLRRFLIDNVEPGSRVITDGWSSYPAATDGLYALEATNVSDSGMAAHDVLPGAHLAFSLVKRWVLGTLQGSVSPEHLQAHPPPPSIRNPLTGGILIVRTDETTPQRPSTYPAASS